MAWSTKASDAIDKLIELFGEADSLAGVTVWDGPNVSKTTVMEVVAVGFTGVEGESEVEGTTVREGLARTPDRENFTIRCAASVLRGGSGTLPEARRRAYEIANAMGAVLATHHTLDGLVLNAMIGSQSLTQDQSASGAQATVTLGIDCDAFTGR